MCGLDTRTLEETAQASSKPTPVLRVYGRASEAEVGETQIGPFTRFRGEFEAVRLTDGEKFRARVAILPQLAEMFVAEGLEKSKDEEGNGALQFGLDITVEKHESTLGGLKFRYGLRPLTKPSEKGKDVLTEMGERFGALPLLSEPAKKTTKK